MLLYPKYLPPAYISIYMELNGFILIPVLLQHTPICILEAYSLNFKLYIRVLIAPFNVVIIDIGFL